MRYSFRLAELLGHVPDPRKRPGTIKAIVEYTGLDRHQVAALLKNEVKYIPMKALSRLCDYLIEYGYVSADQLPGAHLCGRAGALLGVAGPPPSPGVVPGGADHRGRRLAGGGLGRGVRLGAAG